MKVIFSLQHNIENETPMTHNAVNNTMVVLLMIFLENRELTVIAVLTIIIVFTMFTFNGYKVD